MEKRATTQRNREVQVLAVREVRQGATPQLHRGSFLDDLEDHTPMKSDALAQRKAIRGIEDRVLRKALFIVEASVSAQELDPAYLDAIPHAWVEELGLEGAKERHRVAVNAMQNAKEASVYLKIAGNTAMGIIKARATEKAADRPLNIGVIMMAPMRDYETQEVEK